MSGPKRSRLRSLARDGAIVAGISVLLFVALEAGVRILTPQDLRTTYVEGDSSAVKDEVLGHRYRPGSHTITSGPEFSVEFKINADGLRDLTPHPRPKPPGLFRVLLLGDSFAMGAGNGYEAMFPVLFERGLQSGHHADVVKAGVSGYDTRTELLYLKRLLPEFDPDVVVVAFLPNDVFTNRSIAEERAAPTAATDATGGAVKARSDKETELHLVTLAKRMLMSNDRLYVNLYAGTRRAEYFTVPASDHVAQQLEITRNLLLATRDFCRERGVEFMVLAIPQQFQVIAEAGDLPTGDLDPVHMDGMFRRFAADHDFHWFSALDPLIRAYRGGDEHLFYRLDGHLTGEGNRVVADYLLSEFTAHFGALLDERGTLAGS